MYEAIVETARYNELLLNPPSRDDDRKRNEEQYDDTLPCIANLFLAEEEQQ